MNDIKPILFDVIEPVDVEGREQNIRSALSRGLLDFDRRDLGKVNIIANGPSARDLDLASLEGPTVALNGSINLFTRQGLAPTYWAGCDPQALLASFLPDDPPTTTIYLVASKCDPAVFEKLKDRVVNLWHIGDSALVSAHRPVRTASSVTLCILSQFRKIGFRSFDVYGWDGCYSSDGFHHATEPKENFRQATMIELRVGAEVDEQGNFIEGTGRPFSTNHTWALEAQDAVIQLHHADYDVRIHGDGLIKAMTGR